MFTKLTHFIKLFILVYFLLYVFPFPFSYIPIIGKFFSFYNSSIEILTVWIAENIFGIEKIVKTKFTGSGDTLLNYLQLITLVILSFLLSLGLSFSHDEKLKKIKLFIFTYIRYFLAFTLLSYASAKFFEGQFSYPSLERLDQKIGDSSPMGLLWTFMGYSKLYSTFGGICQATAAFLLFFRKTSVLGSLMAFAVMLNILILNFAYDVPVKIFSIHLVVISVMLLAPNFLRLFNFFVLNKIEKLDVNLPLIPQKEINYVIIALKALVIMAYFVILTFIGLNFVQNKNDETSLNAVYYPENSVERVSIKWQKFILNNKYATIFYEDKNYEDFIYKMDTLQNLITLKSKADSLKTGYLNYEILNDKIHFVGKINSDSINNSFSIKRKQDFELVKREFNWINEYPYNK